MPPLEYMDLNDPAVVWGYVRSSREGEPLVLAPIQLMTRWEEGQIEIPNPDGSFLTLDATIATDRNIKLNSIVWEGQVLSDQTFVSFDGITYPSSGPTTDLYEIVTRVRAEDLKGRYPRYEFGLRRYKDIVPKRA
jgi:hypothetical protein